MNATMPRFRLISILMICIGIPLFVSAVFIGVVIDTPNWDPWFDENHLLGQVFLTGLFAAYFGSPLAVITGLYMLIYSYD